MRCAGYWEHRERAFTGGGFLRADHHLRRGGSGVDGEWGRLRRPGWRRKALTRTGRGESSTRTGRGRRTHTRRPHPTLHPLLPLRNTKRLPRCSYTIPPPVKWGRLVCASPVFPPARATQASPPRTTLPPPLRVRSRFRGDIMNYPPLAGRGAAAPWNPAFFFTSSSSLLLRVERW